MKKLITLFSLLFCLLNVNAQKAFCDSSMIEEISNFRMKDGAGFMREYTVMLDSMGSDSILPEQDYSIVLLSNVIYRFVVLGNKKFNCEPILTIEDLHKKDLISSNYQKGKKAEQFDILIKETGAYKLKFSFRNGKQGCAIAGMFYVRNISFKK